MSEALEAQEAEETPIVEESTETTEEAQEITESAEESSEGELAVEAETQEEFEQEVAEAIEEGATEEEIKSMVKKFQLKVNGRTIEKEIDLNDEDSVKRELQKAAAFQQTAQEAAELKKLYESEINRLQQNPWEVLKELGLDPEALNEQFLEDRIQHLKKTPEQIEKETMEKELAAAREKLKNIEKEAAERKEQEALRKAEEELSSEIMEALNAHGTLPPTQKNMARIADALVFAMEYAEENGYDPDSISVADVIPHVEKEIRQEIRDYLDTAPDNVLEEYIGKKNSERLRKTRVAAIKNNPKQEVKPVSKAPKEDNKPREKMRMDDYFRKLNKLAK